MNLGENLKKLRKENNLSQEDLADKLNVSRQSVSKWESGLVYPEMDKVLQICKIFNVNINDIMNEDINEIKENKESKSRFNNYIKNFFNFITKIVKMFSSMTFKEKMKLILEETIIIFILFILGLIINSVFMMIIGNIFRPYHSNNIINAIFYGINNILNSLSILLLIITSISVTVHIFKIRYLNYFHIVDNEDFETLKKDENEKEKILVEDNKKIIIRDPIDSKFSLLNVFTKIIKLLLKMSFCFALLFIIFALILNASLIVVSFKLLKNLTLFIGIILTLLSCLSVLILLFLILFNFIINRKTKFKTVGLVSIISFITFGIGLGIIFISSLSFKTKVLTENMMKTQEYTYLMSDDLYISAYNKKYIIEDREDILIKVKYYKKASVNSNIVERNNPYIYVDVYNNYNTIEEMNDLINNLNNKEIYDYSYYEVEIYTSEENINKLKNN